MQSDLRPVSASTIQVDFEVPCEPLRGGGGAAAEDGLGGSRAKDEGLFLALQVSDAGASPDSACTCWSGLCLRAAFHGSTGPSRTTVFGRHFGYSLRWRLSFCRGNTCHNRCWSSGPSSTLRCGKGPCCASAVRSGRFND